MFIFRNLYWRLLLAALLIAAYPAPSFSADAGTRAAAPSAAPHDFRAVPGVTAEEIAAIEKILATRRSFVYGAQISTEAFSDAKNSPVTAAPSNAAANTELNAAINAPTGGADLPLDGFAKLYCEYLSELFGAEFKLRFYEWNSILNGLADHSIDFTGELTRTPEREKTYLMTDAIAERLHSYIRLSGAESFERIAKIRPVRLLFLEDTVTAEALAPHLEFPFESREVENYDAAYQLLKSGAADALVEEAVAEAAFDGYGDVMTEPVFPPLLTSVSLVTQNPDWAPFIAVMQKVLKNGGNLHLARLYNQGDRRYRRHKLWLQLTPVERAYIQQHRETARAVPVVMEFDNYPISFYNDRERTWTGIAPDVLAEIAELTDLKFQRINDELAPWPVALKMLTTGKAALITELINTPERAGKFLWADAPYAHDRYALLSRVEYPDLNFNEVLYARVGLPEGTGYAEIFTKFFPNHVNTITYSSTIAALDALERDEVDLIMATQNVLLFNTNYREKPGFKVNILLENSFGSIFGFNREETVLRGIISKAQRFVDCPRIVNHWTSRVFDYRARMREAQMPWMIAGFVLLLMIAVLSVVLLIRRREQKRVLEITVQRRTAELQAQTRLAQEASRSKSNFLANMSHEIRTPMNAIIGMTTIYKNTDDDARKDYCIGRIATASTHLLGVINDILDMSKIEAGKMELTENPFSLEGMLRKIISVMMFRLDEKHQKFQLHYDPQLPTTVLGDEQRLAQIITNLLSNAVKFTPEGGKVLLRLEPEAATDDAITIKCAVTDTGIGISPEQQTKLFSAFSQAETDTTRKFGGTGLGLAISKHLVEMMGGKIWIVSELGKGATFAFAARLGRAENTLAAQLADDVNEENAAPPGDNFAGFRLLVAEDVEINREILQTLLEPTQLAIEFAFNGASAVKKFAAAPERYAAIFMDVQMPMLDGYEATRQIRALPAPQAKTIPIIAMTANVFREDVEKCLAAGMNAHLGKPIEHDEILMCLRQYLLPSRLTTPPGQ